MVGYYAGDNFCDTLDKADTYEDYNIAMEMLLRCREDKQEAGVLFQTITL